MKNKTEELCIYCQQNTADTDDHVPPKAIFSKPRPSTLVTVPSCEKCNKHFQLDDDYFKLVVPSRHDVGGNELALQVSGAALKGLTRRKAAGLKKCFLASVDEAEILTKSGLYLGDTLRMQPDFYRIEAVVERTVRGLYYRRHGNAPLPKDCPVWVAMDIGFQGVDEVAAQSIAATVGKLVASDPTVIHPQVFSYWYRDVSGVEFMSVWLLLFFEHIWFIATTNTP